MGFHGEKRVPSLLEKECLQMKKLVYLALALCVMVAAFSGWVGGKMLKKQFEKAGITA